MTSEADGLTHAKHAAIGCKRKTRVRRVDVVGRGSSLSHCTKSATEYIYRAGVRWLANGLMKPS